MNTEKMKKCKWCGELIPTDAQKCFYCMGWQLSENKTDRLASATDNVNLTSKQKRKSFFSHYFWAVDVKEIFRLGRTCSRKEYWLGLLTWLFVSLLPLSVVLFNYGVDGNIIYSIGICSVWMAFSIMCHLSLAVRRLRDINKRIWWLLILLFPPIGSLILIIWFCKPSNYNKKELAKFNIGDTLIILFITFVFVGAFISYSNKDKHSYAKSQDYSHNNECHDDLKSAESKVDEEEKIHAEEVVQESENKYKEFKFFLETVQSAALRKYNRLKANNPNDDYDYDTSCELKKLKSLYSNDFGYIVECLERAKEYIRNKDYKSAIKLAKSVENSIKSGRDYTKQRILELNLSIEENNHQNSSSRQSTSSSHSNEKQQVWRERWKPCISCDGGKCRQCSGHGGYYIGDIHNICGSCSGTGACPWCGGRGEIMETYSVWE